MTLDTAVHGVNSMQHVCNSFAVGMGEHKLKLSHLLYLLNGSIVQRKRDYNITSITGTECRDRKIWSVANVSLIRQQQWAQQFNSMMMTMICIAHHCAILGRFCRTRTSGFDGYMIQSLNGHIISYVHGHIIRFLYSHMIQSLHRHTSLQQCCTHNTSDIEDPAKTAPNETIAHISLHRSVVDLLYNCEWFLKATPMKSKAHLFTGTGGIIPIYTRFQNMGAAYA